MSNLNQALQKQLKTIPRIFLRRAIEKKLQAQGINDGAIIDALTDHILSNKNEVFYWDDGKDEPTNNLSINFSEKDSDALVKKIESFIKNDIPNIVLRIVNDCAKSLVKSLEKQWPEVKIDEANEMRHFRDRLDLRWSRGLDPLRMMLISAREVGEEFLIRLSRSKAKTGLAKREAIGILHARACLTTAEIITLLENGFPDGAYARWRTLYEISVVALLIDRFGDTIAQRYLDHDAVSMHEYMINEFKFNGVKYHENNLEDYQKIIQENYYTVIKEYGDNFATPYGWAAYNLGLKRPRFQDLEQAVDWASLSPQYKWSSYKVHAGATGTVRTLGTVGVLPVILAGATNAGIETPAIHTAFSLLHVTSLIFGRASDMEVQVKMRALVLLRDKVVKECSKAASRLEADELAIQAEIER